MKENSSQNLMSSTPPQNVNNRQTNWDLLRCISMWMVCGVHSCTFFGWFDKAGDSYFGTSIMNNVPVWLWTILMTSNAIFFSLSGMFSIKSLEPFNLWKYYYKKFVEIVVPYFIFTLIACIISSFSSGNNLTLKGYIIMLTSFSGGGYWFVAALIPLLIIAPFLYKLLNSLTNKQIISLLSIILVLFALNFLSPIISNKLIFNHPTLSSLLNFPNKLLGSGTLLISIWMFFFIIGYVFKRFNAQYHKIISSRRYGISSILVMVIFVLALYPLVQMKIIDGDKGGNSGDLFIPRIIIVIAMFIIFSSVTIKSKIFSKILEHFGKNMYGVYLLQYAVISLLVKLHPVDLSTNLSVLKFFITWFVVSTFAFIISSLLSVAINFVLINPLRKFLYGISGFKEKITSYHSD
jgi:hypothetical protein